MQTRTKRRGMIAAGLLVLGAGVPAAMAAGAWSGGGCHRGAWSEADVAEHLTWAGEHLMDEVDGSDAQRASMDRIVQRVTPQVQALHAEGRALKADLRDGLEAGDAAAMEEIRQDGLDWADRSTALAFSVALQVRGILDEDQRAELAEKSRRFHGEAR